MAGIMKKDTLDITLDNIRDLELDKIKSNFNDMSTEDIAISIVHQCNFNDPDIVFWLIERAPMEALTFSHNIAFINCVEYNRLDFIKAFVARGAMPQGDELISAVGEVCTKYHQDMAVYFIETLDVDVNLDPVILQPYLLAKGLSPMEYLSSGPEKHRIACLSILDKPIEKSAQEMMYNYIAN